MVGPDKGIWDCAHGADVPPRAPRLGEHTRVTVPLVSAVAFRVSQHWAPKAMSVKDGTLP